MFVIRSFPRCGTHMLRTALDTHSRLTCHGELFHATVYGHALQRLGAVGHLESFELEPLDGFVAHGIVPSEGQPFIQIYEDLWQALRVFHVPIVALRRRDQIRRLASQMLAGRHRQWFRAPNQPPTYEAIKIHPEQLVRNFHGTQANDLLTEKWYPWAHVVHYEDLVTDWPVEVRKIQQYLDVPVESLVPTIAKQDNRPIREIVENFDELKQKLGHQLPTLFQIAEEGAGRADVPTNLQDLK